MSPRKCLFWTLAGLGLLTAAFWFSTLVMAQDQDVGGDTPIIVKNGSIVIQSQGVDLASWVAVDDNTMNHPHQNKAMGTVEVTGGGSNTTCSGRGRCVIVANWSTGQTVRVVARNGGSRGLRLQSSVSLKDANWTKGAQEWKFPLSGKPKLTVTIVDQDTNGQPQTICTGSKCSIKIHYQ